MRYSVGWFTFIVTKKTIPINGLDLFRIIQLNLKNRRGTMDTNFYVQRGNTENQTHINSQGLEQLTTHAQQRDRKLKKQSRSYHCQKFAHQLTSLLHD